MQAIRTDRLTKIHGDGNSSTRAVSDFSIDIAEGEFIAIMGPSGCGKSTLLNIMGGLERPTSGSVSVLGTDISDLSERNLAVLRAEKLGFVFQHFNLLDSLTIRQNVEVPALMTGEKRGPARRRAMELLDDLGLADAHNRLPHELSGGQQQRVAIARALLRRPEIVLADEPTGNLDSTTGNEILAFMRRAVDDFGQTIVMVTHDPVAASYANRVIFLVDGKIVDELVEPTPDSVLDMMKSLGD
jgi:putative ABC transport system ATP-binding protein